MKKLIIGCTIAMLMAASAMAKPAHNTHKHNNSKVVLKNKAKPKLKCHKHCKIKKVRHHK